MRPALGSVALLVLGLAVGFGAGAMTATLWSTQRDRTPWVLWQKVYVVPGDASTSWEVVRAFGRQRDCEQGAVAEANSYRQRTDDLVRYSVQGTQVTQLVKGAAVFWVFAFECFPASFDPARGGSRGRGN